MENDTFNKGKKRLSSSGGGYKPLCEKETLREPQSLEETVRERAARQRRETQAELTFNQEDYDRCARNRERVLAERKAAQEQWRPVEGEFPLLVFETQNKMDDHDAPDMISGDEDRIKIESYGFMQPFKNRYAAPQSGYPASNYTLAEDQFLLPASEHFERMRGLANDLLLGFGFSTKGETKDVFFEMVDKFERSEGGYYSNPSLNKALQEHETTQLFHKALKKCLADNVKNGKLPDDILSVSSQYMMSSKGEKLPKFDFYLTPKSLFDGTVLTVHDIWSMRVYAESLEFKGTQLRGVFRYEVQDHFGLDHRDIDHEPSEPHRWYEQLEGFRSWYLLQHFESYGYKPFITEMDFKL